MEDWSTIWRITWHKLQNCGFCRAGVAAAPLVVFTRDACDAWNPPRARWRGRLVLRSKPEERRLEHQP